MVQQSHNKLALALRPGVAENERDDFVKIVLVLFAQGKHPGFDAPAKEGLSICVLLEKVTENVNLVLFQTLYISLDNLGDGEICPRNTASSVGRMFS